MIAHSVKCLAVSWMARAEMLVGVFVFFKNSFHAHPATASDSY